ncbi:MAG: Rad52/Rad22 family DNA repair protein, partial [Chloroflexota bacterium]|nr:Rad52/Rad22 family DNA repair protein [Chloroflexota bacterium]
IGPDDLDAMRPDKHQLFMQTLTEAQVDFLLQRTPKHEIKLRQGRGGMQFSYVEHGYVTERLNLVFGFNWDFEIVDKQILEDEVIVEARLTVRTPNGQTIVKTQFGGADIKRHASGAKSGRPLSIADDYKAAASDALKKCASLLGIGLDLYGRDRPFEDDLEQAAPPTERVTFDAPVQKEAAPAVSPIGAPQPGLCSKRQQREIVDLAVEAGMDIAELRRTLGVSDLAQLTEARAQRVIQRLRELTTQAQAS